MTVPATPGTRLTDLEIEILTALALGMTDRQIAKRFYVSENTAKSHVKQMSMKLGAVNRANMVAIGFVKGYLRLTPGTLVAQPRAAGVR